MVNSDLMAKQTKPKKNSKPAAAKPKAVVKKTTKKTKQTVEPKIAKAEPKRAKAAVKKAKKPKRDPNKPKRARSAYLFFCNEEREKIKKTNPSMSAPDVLRACGKAWEEAKKGDISKWQKMQDDDKERAGREMSKYKAPVKESANEESEESEAEKSHD